MHIRPFRCRTAWPVLCICAVLFLGWAVESATAQPKFPGSGSNLNANLRVYPLDVWGPRAGAGAAAGLVVNNLGRQHAQWLLTAAPAAHEQVGTFSFDSANPRRARRYVSVHTRALHTDRLWFYGLGPASRSSSRLAFDHTAVRTHLQAGQAVLGQRLRLQPHATLQYHRITDIDGTSVLRPPSAAHLARLQPGRDPGREQIGVRLGASVQLDTRDDARRPTEGLLLQGIWDHYVSLDDSGLDFDQLDLNAYGYVPLGGAHRLALQGRLAVTFERDDVPVPFYQLPTLDGSLVPGWNRSRFVGADRLITSALYRFPLFDVSGLVRFEGHLGIHAASVYDDIGDQFEASLSFDDPLPAQETTFPLRPAISAGLQFGLPLRTRTLVELALGGSPEGVSGVRLTFSRDLSLTRPPHHTSRSQR